MTTVHEPRTAHELHDQAEAIANAAMTPVPTGLALLRQAFKPEQIGKLPRGGTFLDYVGHADVTDRLLSADPEWDWQPIARDVDPTLMAAAIATGSPALVAQVVEMSPPKFDLDAQGRPVGLWIKLTVCGVSRLGYGSVPSGAFDAEKQLISDALRNAAMRFGVALALWTKGGLESEAEVHGDYDGRQVARIDQRPQWELDGWTTEDEARTAITALAEKMGQVDADHKAPLRAWLEAHAYPMVRPVPIKAEHAGEWEKVLDTALEVQAAEAAGSTEQPSGGPESAPSPVAGGSEPEAAQGAKGRKSSTKATTDEAELGLDPERPF